jgi:tRNA pseudouridine38-40 synthase
VNYYKTIIQYEGTHYAGFQYQNNLKTVQSEFNKALEKLVEGKVTTKAASRTDTGVHALYQVVKITSTNPLDLSAFLQTFNQTLPSSIKCLSIEVCPGNFHPSAFTISKEYRYLFTNKTQVAKDDLLFVANISNPLDFKKIDLCIQAMIGKHDFCNFYSNGSNVKTTVREIFLCELKEIDPHSIFPSSKLFHLPSELKKCYEFRIIANGFLKQMIRHIVSALWMVGSGKISVDEFLILLHGPKDERQKWKVASPNGLYLFKISY